MRTYLIGAVCALALCMTVPCAGQEEPPLVPEAQPPVSGRSEQQPVAKTISLDIKGMDVIDVLKMLASRSGMNIVVGRNVAGRVTLFLKDVDVMDAFEIILSSNDLAYDRRGTIINVMSQRDYELIYGQRYQDKKQAKIIQLKFAKAAELSRALSQIKTNIGRVVVDEASNTLVLIDSPDKVAEMAEFAAQADMPLQTRVFALDYAQSEKLASKVQELVTKGVGSVRVDERTNKMVVTDYPQKITEIGAIIKAFDEKTPQVVIDAQIVEVSPKDQFSAGVDWDYWLKKNVRLASSLAAPALTGISGIPNKLSFGVLASGATAAADEVGEYKAAIDLLRVIGDTKILSSPRIMALNNQEAKILVGTKEAYITSSTSQTGTGTVTSQSVNFVDVGIKLYVTPNINRKGFVTMKIRPEISSSVATTLTAEDKKTQVPIVTTSETETTIMVKDGATIIIAGLKRDKAERELKKLPVAGDLPLIGAAFRSSKNDTAQTELVIFITPRIVSGEESVAYESLTQDKNILAMQRKAQQATALRRMSVGQYKQLVLSRIKAQLAEYRKGQVKVRGSAIVSFVLNSDGTLAGEPVVVSGGNVSLGHLAVASVRDAGPFPPFPASLPKEQESFRMKLAYQ